MLEYNKYILERVSFDKTLFVKELEKSIKWLEPDQVGELRDWCHSRFMKEYRDEIEQVFMSTLTDVYEQNY